MKIFSRLLSVITISIDGSHITCKKGKIHPETANDLRSFFSGLKLSKAEIWIDGSRKVTFSDEIPVKYHQKLRNLLIGVHAPS